MAQVTEDGGVRFLTRAQVIEELSTNPDAEIYDADGKRLAIRRKIESVEGFEVFERGDRDQQAIPPAVALGLVPDEKIAYKR